MIRVLIGLSLSVFSIEAAFAQSTTISTRGWTRQLRVFSGQTPIRNITVQMRNNQIDISQVVEHIETLLDRSFYYNISVILDSILPSIKGQLSELCNNSNPCLRNLDKNIRDAETRLMRKQSQRKGKLFPNSTWRTNDLAAQSGCYLNSVLRQMDDFSQCSHFCVAGSSCVISTLSIRGSNMKVMDKLKKLRPSCLKRIIDQVKDKQQSFERYYVPDTCRGMNSQGRVICVELKEYNRLMEHSIQEMTSLISSSTPSQNVSSSNVCDNYKLEEDRYIEHRSSTTERDLNTYYVVKRNQDGSYTIPLAMEFEAASDYQTYHDPSTGQNISKNQVPSQYFRKVQNCINESANPNLFGPNGEKLNIEIQDTKNSTCIPKHSISITKKGDRGHAGNYAANISCANVIHEILHKLGLSDEYSTINDNPHYDCRVVQSNSIMSLTWERFCNVEHIAPSQTNYCSGRTSCQIRTQNLNRRSRRSLRHRSFRAKRRNTNTRYCSKSLLDPAHFNAILYGDCSEIEDVKLFRECSTLSYQSSTNDNHHDCLNEKKYCESQNVLNRPSQQTSIRKASSVRTRRSRRRRGIR